MCSNASNMRTTAAFTVESTPTRSAHAEEFVSEAKPAEGPAGKSNGDQSWQRVQ